MTLEDLEARFPTLAGEGTHHRDQRLGVVACSEALVAARMGNYGVGAVLIEPNGEILERGRNTVFFPRFRSDLPAEMAVMTAFEEKHPAVVARLLIAGVQTVKFLAHDDLGGMVNQRHSFPGAWRRLWQQRDFVQADVSEGLRQFALDVFLLNLESCRRRLLSR